MNSLSRQFFSSVKPNPFHSVRILSEEAISHWDEIRKVALHIPRGWFELSRVSPEDRVEFTRDFWLENLPYHPVAHPAFVEFFDQLDDVAVVLVQTTEEEPMNVELVYSLRDNSSFFRGKPPTNQEGIAELQEELNCPLPQDYLAFLKIHNGFGKLSEMGLLEIEDIPDVRRRLYDLVFKAAKAVQSGDHEVDPGALVPFYEALGLSSFQCFYSDWYPGSEMGNVYFSGIDYTISDVRQKRAWAENLAFPTFSEWFSNYLQGMNLCI